MDLAGERGGVTDGMRGLALTLVIMALILFEVGAAVTNMYQLDDITGRAAQAAATAWRQSRAGAPIVAAVDGVVDGQATVRSIDVSRADGTVEVSLQRAPTPIVLGRIPSVRDKLLLTVTREAELNPTGL